MSPAFLVRLRPTTPWRTGSDSGERERTETIYHSDALFSAVCSAMERLGRLKEWLAAAAPATGEPSVRFSSCFPFCGDTLYFAPPRNLWPPSGASRQRWKGARFVPRQIVERLLAGKGIEEERWTVDASSQCLLAIDRRGAANTPFRMAVRSAAAVDRLKPGAVAVHPSACLEFAPDAGLWFVVQFASGEARDRWAQPVRAALRLLADTGYGGGRSRGWGRSEMPEITEGELPGLLLRIDVPRPAVERKSAPPAAAAPEPVPPVEAAVVPEPTAAEPVGAEVSAATAELEPEAPSEAAVIEEPAPVESESQGGEPEESPVSVVEAPVPDDLVAAETAPEEPVAAEPAAAELAAQSVPASFVAHLAAPPVQPPPASAFWMLSLFSPGNEDTIDWQRGAYSIVERTGRVESFVASGGRKRSVRMLAEGSVVIASSDPCGAAPDVSPDGHPHPVYRAGYAVSISIPWRSV